MGKRISVPDIPFSTLIDLLRSRATQQPQQRLYTFLTDGETEKASYTHAQLDDQARTIAGALQGHGSSFQATPGTRALLIYPSGLEFIAAFFGCLYSGIVAVPVYPPSTVRAARTLNIFRAIAENAQPDIILTCAVLSSKVAGLLSQTPSLAGAKVLVTDQLASEAAQHWREPETTARTLAFLQYTSGSTGIPKGVMMTHGNLLHNSSMLARVSEHSQEARSVTWLPLYHDMGLIAGVLQPLYAGFHCAIMAPATFLQRPYRWLQAISDWRATMSMAPNFAYDLCVRKVTPGQKATLDLSCWENIISGAEPVRLETLERFAEAFAQCGLRRSFFYAAYGLAEATLIVSGGKKGVFPTYGTFQVQALEQNLAVDADRATTADKDMCTLVSIGRTQPEQRLLIVDPQTGTECAEMRVGEVWISGPSVAQGYWQREEETEQTFRAYLANGEGPFLRTADLGFLRAGECFLTGRLKDLIIIRGNNHYPQDIERTVEHCHQALRAPGCAAFSVDVAGEERLIVVQEVERTFQSQSGKDVGSRYHLTGEVYTPNLHKSSVNVLAEAVIAIREAVALQHELQVYAVVLIKPASLPKTSSGKVQRRATRAAYLNGTLEQVYGWEHQNNDKEVPQQNEGASQGAALVTRDVISIQNWLVTHLSQVLKVEDVDKKVPFAQYGMDSAQAVSLSGELQDWLARPVAATIAYDYPTIEALAHYLAGEKELVGATRGQALALQAASRREHDSNAIAIIGLGCRFPGADNPAAFWQMLYDGVDSITEVPLTRWDTTTCYTPEKASSAETNKRWGGFLSNIEHFDPTFFHISPREAVYMDPQQRLLLEVAWETFEHASIVPERLAGSRTGVFVGISTVDHYALHYTHADYHQAYTGTGNAHSIAANRLSYTFDLRGPSMAIDTACSSSLVAVHQACQSLRNSECELALAGGVNVMLTPELTISLSQARTMSSAGCCKTFDEAADGYVRGEGCGLVLLKPLAAAERDGDPILAIIRGSAVNQDGRSNGLTAPNGPAQEAVISSALQQAGLRPDEISYVETHGSSTPLGDPIEVDSLKAVLMQQRNADQPCWLGAVKTNIGHLEAAAGIAGLIKTVLCLQKGIIAPNLHFKSLNPHISFTNTTFAIPTQSCLWPEQPAGQRFAGVSSFGFGGTNAHVILQSAPAAKLVQDEATPASNCKRSVQLLTLSGKSAPALRVLAQRYLDFISTHPTVSLADLCCTTNTGRTHFAHRLAVYAEDAQEMAERLAAFVAGQSPQEVQVGHGEVRRGRLAFLFPGQGCQYINMARQLYETQPVFRAALDECDRLLSSAINCAATDLRSLLYPASGATSPLNETVYTQPALFALEYALAQMWLSWGVKPDAVMGHSMGEYVAACIAGLFSLEDGLKLIAARGRLMQALPEQGTMAVIFAGAAAIQPFLEPFAQDVAIAALNGPQNTVISGRAEIVHLIVQRISAACVAKGVSQTESVILPISHASHCPLVEPMLDAFEQVAREVTFLPVRIPLICNLSGQLLNIGETLDASYWRRHTREAVQFATGVQTLSAHGYELFLELGPTPVLSKMGKRSLSESNALFSNPSTWLGKDISSHSFPTSEVYLSNPNKPTENALWLSSLHQDYDDWHVLMHSIASLYSRGCNLDWSAVDGDDRHSHRNDLLMALPTYPFEREVYWFKSKVDRRVSPALVAPTMTPTTATAATATTTVIGSRAPIKDAPTMDEYAPSMGGLVQNPKTFWGMGGFGDTPNPAREASPPGPPSPTTSLVSALGGVGKRVMDFSLIFFSSNETSFSGEKYQLAIESAKYADQHGFCAVWIPERHFTKDGWLYPNPAVLLAALARETSRIHLRAGSVVVPLHHPLRIAEDWAMVDNLSGGRVGVSFASGWHPNDFSLAPENYAKRSEVMYRNIEIVRKLWRGETVPFKGGNGEEIELSTYPSPVQREIPIWLTAAGNPKTFVGAGKLGANLLTHMYNQSIEELAEKIRLYRNARAEHGYDAATGKVSVMLHAYIGADVETVYAQVKGPFSHYLKSASYLVDAIAYSRGQRVDLSRLSEQDLQDYMGFVTERLIREQRVLFGTPETCAPLITQLRAAGVDEIACQMDFGVDSDLVLKSLPYLNMLRLQSNAGDEARTTYPVEVELPQSQVKQVDGSNGRLVSQAVPYTAAQNGHNDLYSQERKLDASHEQARNVSENNNGGANVLQTLRTAHKRERHTLLATYVREQVAEILRIPVARLDNEQLLTALGFDSLMGIELKNRIGCALQVNIPILILLHQPSIAQFVDELLILLDESAPGQAQEIAPTMDDGSFSRVPVISPLSHNQKALWFLFRLAPESVAYNVLYAARIRQQLDVAALQRALWALVDRYPVLTATYTLQDGEPVQQIQLDRTISLEEVDASCMSLEELKLLLETESNQPIDLTRGPVLRLMLYRRADDDYVLSFIFHHITADLRALELLLDELCLLYAMDSPLGSSQQAAGTRQWLPEPGFQLADYIRWQRSMLQSSEGERHWQYWQQELAGDLPLLLLPIDRPRPPLQTYKGASYRFSVSRDLAQRLRTVASEQHVTPFTLVLAAYQVLLHRYCNQDDILIGTPALGRTRLELEHVIGSLTNLVAVRVRFEHDLTFNVLLQQTKRAVLDALAHHDFPFTLLVERLQPQRDLSYPPIFQTFFVWDRPRAHQREELPSGAASLSMEPFAYGQQGAESDLGLTIFEMEEGQLVAVFRYNVDLFEASTIARMAEHFLILLDAIVTNPEQPVREIPLLSEAERHALLLEWNVTQCDYPQDMCLHQLFEQQAERTADSIAVVFEEVQLTYQQLNTQANQLSSRLLEEGIGAEQLVGVYMERSVELVVALLAVLKAGGVYVPLDPSYPQGRIAYMLEDAQLTLLLTQAHLCDRLPPAACKIISLTGELPEQDVAASKQTDNAHGWVEPQNLAYVIYTSGSTGQPKGVQITHANVSRLFAALADKLHFQSSDVWTMFHAFTFDVSVWEMWGALLSGARLVVVPYWLSRSPRLFWQELRREQVTILSQTPSAFRQLIQVQDGQSMFLRAVIFAGEALQLASLQPWVQCYGDEMPQLINMYGITETTVHVTYRRISEQVIRMGAASLIGQPLSDLQLYVLDEHQQLVPMGVTGEAYVGGAGLARGYLGRPELTAERFIPHPVAAQFIAPGARLYRTGDLVQYGKTGELEYMGRVDSQVKVRGFRIELGEIEATLLRHPAVREVVVLAREDIPGDQRLVAYVVGEGSQELAISELRRYLQERLPDYMIPASFVLLDALPLTSHGKANLQALLENSELVAASQATPTLGLSGAAPSTPLQEALVQIWQEVLGLPQVGIHEDFFELGGHSLLGMQIVARIQQTLAVDVALRNFFEAPTIAALARHIESLIRIASYTDVPALVPMQRPDELPLSFAQERLWFLHHWEPDSAWYNMPIALRLCGQLHVGALAHTLATIVQRYEALRTTFEQRETGPVQVIALSLPLHMPLLDLCGWAKAERDQLVSQLVREEAERSFDLAHGPLVRAYLLRLDEQEYILLLTLHHIVCDGWSIGVLVREMTRLYQAYVSGEASPLPPLPLQYADYALWQRQWLQGTVLEAQLSYWRQQLADIEPLALPTDYPRPGVKTQRGALQSRLLPPTLLQGLLRLCQRQNVTLFMLLLAAFQVLLMRYSGQTDISVGTPVANRTLPQLEGMIGFFVNTLVLRTDLRGHLTFEHLLHRVREVCLGAYANQDIPFEKVVAELAPGRDMSRSPLFQVMLVFQNAHGEAQLAEDLGGVSITPLSAESATSKFDLTLSLAQTGQGLHCVMEYSTDLFEAETIVRWLAHWQVLLEGIVQDAQAYISYLPLLTEAERVQLLQEWNATGVDMPADVCLPQLFERQVEQTPDSIAIVFEEQQLSYDSLNSQANQLASRLWQMGIGPDELVGVCMERSLELVVALLAVLKAGGAYVPLDPSYPQERFAFLFADAQVSFVLTQVQLYDRSAPFGVKVICVEALPTITTGEAYANSIGVQPDNLAYLIYTSGSTGKPKGAMNSHRGICNRLHWMQQAYQLTQKDRVLQKTPLSFDVSVWEFFWPLSTGAALIVAAPGGHQDPSYLRALIAEQGVSTLHFVPSMLQAFLTEQHLASCISLRQVICSGEALTASLQARFFDSVAKEVQLHNLYGPTEAAIDVTFWPCQRESEDIQVPIGRPIANTQIYLLDASLQPVPIGVVGELYIGGVALARGYYNHPDLTAEKFIANPFGAGERLYRTGDLARYIADGNIEYVGRVDHQVKLRGMRIELGEIEAVLQSHPAIQETVVILHEESEVRKVLVAYVVAHEEKTLTAHEVQEYLRARLPDYMVPTFVMFLDVMPLTPNGKVARKALPTVDFTQWVQHEEPEVPCYGDSLQVTLHELLGQIWQDVLGLPQVGIHDNFFELGGHSLLATQVVTRIHRTIKVDLPLRSLFEAPTIAQLSHYLEASLRLASPQLLQPVQPAQGNQVRGCPVERPDNLPLSFAQERLWFLDQWMQGSSWYNVPIALRLSGWLDVQALERTLATVIQRHESLRTTFELRDGHPVQVIAPSLSFQVPVIDLCGLTGTESDGQVMQLARAEAGHSFDLAHGPLLRVCLLRFTTCAPCAIESAALVEHVLLFTLHHIVTDGWSMDVLMREITMLYQAEIGGEPAQLPALPMQYADYALWQRQWLQGEILEVQLAYWRKQLSGVPASLDLPTDYPRPAVQTGAGARLIRHLSPTLLQGLKDLSQQAGVTLFMTLLAAFQVLLMRYSGQQDIVVGSPIANRTREELEGLVGFFVNTLALRTDLSGNPSFLQLLARVREVALQAYAHQDIPFEKLVLETQLQRDLSRHPLFQVLFSLEQTSIAQLALLELSANLMYVESYAAKFDLSLVASEELEGGLQLVMHYNTDLFTVTTIDRLLHYWQTLLEAIVQQPEQHITTLPLLTAEERQQLLITWNATTTAPLLEDVCVHQLFEHQVAQIPECVAVVCGEEHLTYEYLNCKANQLSHYLQRQGSQPQGNHAQDNHAQGNHKGLPLQWNDDTSEADSLSCGAAISGGWSEIRVGLCLEKGPLSLIAQLAIFKAGWAYVFLDPAEPSTRLASIIDDARPHMILIFNPSFQSPSRKDIGSLGLPRGEVYTPNLHESSGNALAHVHVKDYAGTILSYEQCWQALPVEAAANPTVQLTAANLAYIVYTSGSTGRPKGVMSTHRGVVNYLRFLMQSYQLRREMTVLQIPPLGFDASVRDSFGTLVAGGRLVLTRSHETRDLQRMLVLLQEQHITHLLSIVPSFLRTLFDVAQTLKQSCPTVRQILISGENLSLAEVARARRIFAKHVEVVNQYGPTETTMTATYYRVAPASPAEGIALVGRPIANMQVYLLDQHMQPVPIGVAGEVYLGGPGLAWGYLGRPDATAEKFVPHPFVRQQADTPAAIQSGERLYRTGDLACYQSDGAIKYLGRSDQQVKIRGNRVEPGEIEQQLQLHSGVKQCVVMMREDHPGEPQLAAYLVCQPVDAVPTAQELHQFLQARLPDYMLPTHFVRISELPLTPNGKVDRRALPASDLTYLSQNEAFVAPQTPLQERLAAMWTELLHLSQVSIHDNFFLVGGHSLLAAQLMLQIQTVIGVKVPLRTLFEASTIAEMAEAIQHIQSEQIEQTANEELAQMLTALGGLSEDDIQAIFGG